MLPIIVPAGITEFWDENKEEFVYIKTGKDYTLHLEHSLLSIRKWESRWHKSYLNAKHFTYEEDLDYIKCMTMDSNVPDEVYGRLTEKNRSDIYKYINDPHTATTFSSREPKKPTRDVITAELIYQWMIELGIPFECQKWHLNQLITLIRVCRIKTGQSKKMSKSETAAYYASLNAARKKKWKTKG